MNFRATPNHTNAWPRENHRPCIARALSLFSDGDGEAAAVAFTGRTHPDHTITYVSLKQLQRNHLSTEEIRVVLDDATVNNSLCSMLMAAMHLILSCVRVSLDTPAHARTASRSRRSGRSACPCRASRCRPSAWKPCACSAKCLIHTTPASRWSRSPTFSFFSLGGSGRVHARATMRAWGRKQSFQSGRLDDTALPMKAARTACMREAATAAREAAARSSGRDRSRGSSVEHGDGLDFRVEVVRLEDGGAIERRTYEDGAVAERYIPLEPRPGEIRADSMPFVHRMELEDGGPLEAWTENEARRFRPEQRPGEIRAPYPVPPPYPVDLMHGLAESRAHVLPPDDTVREDEEDVFASAEEPPIARGPRMIPLSSEEMQSAQSSNSRLDETRSRYPVPIDALD